MIPLWNKQVKKTEGKSTWKMTIKSEVLVVLCGGIGQANESYIGLT